MFVKQLIALTFSASILIAAVGCTNEEAAPNSEENAINQESQEAASDTVAIVNGEEITQAELDQSFTQIKQTYEQQGVNLDEEGSEEQIRQIKIGVLNQLINTKLIIQSAEKANYEPTSDEIDQSLEQITSQFPNEEELNSALEESNTSLEQLKEEIAKELKMNKYVADHTPGVTVTDEEVIDMYDQYSEQIDEAPEFDQIKEQIKQDLIKQKEQQELKKLIDELRKDSDIEILI